MDTKIVVERKHEICCGHRVVEQGGQCERLHGHNYTIHFVCGSAGLNEVGMVIDFSAIKSKLCQWLEDNFDHRFLMWEDDPWLTGIFASQNLHVVLGIVVVPFNPTAENIAEYLLNDVGPIQLHDTGVTLVKVVVEETGKCLAVAELK